jgi:hypothetical protein
MAALKVGKAAASQCFTDLRGGLLRNSNPDSNLDLSRMLEVANNDAGT